MKSYTSDNQKYVFVADEFVTPEEVIDFARKNGCTVYIEGVEHFRISISRGTTGIWNADDVTVRINRHNYML